MIRITERTGKIDRNTHSYIVKLFAHASVALSVLSNLLPGLAMTSHDEGTKMPCTSVFVITNRKAKSTAAGIASFGVRRGASMSYAFMSAETRTGGDKHSTHAKVLTALTSEEFFQRLASAKKNNIVVFVHGYNCNVKVPYSIAAHLGQTLDLPVVMFSWPSKRNPFTYASDECNAEWSTFQLADVLQELDKHFGNANIILVGHSMGCRMLCWAIQHTEAAEKQQTTKYKNIFFCAPDIDSQVFEKNIPLLSKSSNDTTVFASTKDVRLFFSKVLHGNSRLGLLPKSTAEKKSSSSINIVDYTNDDKTVFGHAVPYQLIKQRI